MRRNFVLKYLIIFVIVSYQVLETTCKMKANSRADEPIADLGPYPITHRHKFWSKCHCARAWNARTQHVVRPMELIIGKTHTRPRKRPEIAASRVREQRKILHPILKPFIKPSTLARILDSVVVS
ncbi:hypothetical protein Ocin01_06868 [Orchesella cincta]|uniref:Secreted protein n=1 Tax=Orchesella cincta TaxID=48709 RepID=A0A1D2N422_ORCCI|nr:hypothetical protein Ocin01_06868 [Orchesella cincta]